MAPAAKTAKKAKSSSSDSEEPPTAKSTSTVTGATSLHTDIVTAVNAMTTTAASSDEAASPTIAADSTVAAAGGAAEPRVADIAQTPLRHMNSTSVKHITWEVTVAYAHEEEYSYNWEGKQITGKKFQCMLVFVQDTKQYCVGEVRKTRGMPPNWLAAAKQKFQDGCKFRISSVELNIKAKAEYNSTTVKNTVDLQKTTTTKLLADQVHRHPQPVVTCAECTAFKNVQAFDITAFILEVPEPRTVSGNKRVRDIKIIDGSVDTGVPPPKGQP